MSFGENICIMMGSRHMKHLYLTKIDLITHKVNVHFNMVCALMLYWIVRKIDGCDIITVQHKKLYQEENGVQAEDMQPTTFSYNICSTLIRNLSIGVGKSFRPLLDLEIHLLPRKT